MQTIPTKKLVIPDYETINSFINRNDIEYPVPPVCTAGWDGISWYLWIRQHGRNKITKKPLIDKS